MRLGILTGGGDVPGLNTTIKCVVEEATSRGWDVTGIRRGWKGLLFYQKNSTPEEQSHWVENLNPSSVRTIDRYGGTHLHSSRTNPASVKKNDLPDWIAASYGNTTDCTKYILQNLQDLDLQALITIGGDDTLSYSLRLHQENFPVVAIPKTMDNDVVGTDYCIGFSTAISRSTEMINNLRTSAGSHERITFVELFGRMSGETALFTSLLAGADRTLIPEVKFSEKRLAKLLIQDKIKNPSRYAIVVVSEGAMSIDGKLHEKGEPDAYGHKKLGGVAETLASDIACLTDEETQHQHLGYLMRSGAPDSLDRMVARQFAHLAISNLAEGKTGNMTALQQGCYTNQPLEETGGSKQVDMKLYDAKNYRPQMIDPSGLPMFLT